MKKVTLIVAIAIGTIFTSCEKEDSVNLSGNNNAKSKSQIAQNDKSASADFELMAKAANIKSIDIVGNTYEVKFYGTTDIYEVEVITFDTASFIELEIKLLGSTKVVEIDIDNEQFDIDDVGSYTFSEYENTVISTNSNIYSDLAAIISVYHYNNPTANLTVADNGIDDVFPDDNDGERKFFGRGISSNPCFMGQQNNYSTFYVFGMGFGYHFIGVGSC